MLPWGSIKIKRKERNANLSIFLKRKSETYWLNSADGYEQTSGFQNDGLYERQIPMPSVMFLCIGNNFTTVERHCLFQGICKLAKLF